MEAFYLILAMVFISVKCHPPIDIKCGEKVAYTHNGVKCLNKCENGKCIIDESLQLYNCRLTEEDTLIHRTIHEKVCLSCCVERSSYTGRCMTKPGTWDYCDSNTTVTWVRDRAFTDSNGPCKDACRSTGRRYSYRPKCNHYWQGSDWCEPGVGYNFIQARTITGKLCRGSCHPHLGRDYTWCAYGMRNEEACVLPGMPPQRDWSKHIEDLLSLRDPICINIQNPDTYETDLHWKEDSDDFSLDRLARDLESDPKHTTIYLHNNTNPVYSHTYKPGLFRTPKVVRASIRPADIFDGTDDYDFTMPQDVQANLNKMGRAKDDEYGYLVNRIFSGPKATYNIINLKHDTSSSFIDVKMKQFLEDNSHFVDAKADLLIVVLYHEGETRPKGIARHLKLYHSQSLVEDYYVYVPINDSDDEMKAHSAPFKVLQEKSLLPTVDLNGPVINSYGQECYSFTSEDWQFTQVLPGY